MMTTQYLINGQVFTLTDYDDHEEDKFDYVQLYQFVKEDSDFDDDSIPLDISIKQIYKGLIINDNVFLNDIQWHTLTYVNKRVYRCAVCSTYCEKDKSQEHMDSTDHLELLYDAKPLKKYDLSIIRKISSDKHHCGVCNITFDIEDVKKHEISELHEGNLLYALNKVTDLNLVKKENPTNDSSKKHHDTFDDIYATLNQLNEKENWFNENKVGSLFIREKNGNDTNNNRTKVNPVVNIPEKEKFPNFSEQNTSYANVARTSKVYIPEHLIITHKDKRLKVNFDNWHMIVETTLHVMYCQLCKSSFQARFKCEHCQSQCHVDKLKKAEIMASFDHFVIRKFDSISYHCGHCNTLQYIGNINTHLLHSQPKSNAQSTSTATRFNRLTEFKSSNATINPPQRYTTNANENIFAFYNDNGSHIASVTGINNQLTRPYYTNTMFMSLYMTLRPFGINLTILRCYYNTIKDLNGINYCFLCDSLCLEPIAHIVDWKHRHLLGGAEFIARFENNLIRAIRGYLHCTLCNESIPCPTIYEHNAKEGHTDALLQAMGLKTKTHWKPIKYTPLSTVQPQQFTQLSIKYDDSERQEYTQLAIKNNDSERQEPTQLAIKNESENKYNLDSFTPTQRDIEYPPLTWNKLLMRERDSQSITFKNKPAMTWNKVVSLKSDAANNQQNIESLINDNINYPPLLGNGRSKKQKRIEMLLKKIEEQKLSSQKTDQNTPSNSALKIDTKLDSTQEAITHIIEQNKPIVSRQNEENTAQKTLTDLPRAIKAETSNKQTIHTAPANDMPSTSGVDNAHIFKIQNDEKIATTFAPPISSPVAGAFTEFDFIKQDFMESSKIVDIEDMINNEAEQPKASNSSEIQQNVEEFNKKDAPNKSSKKSETQTNKKHNSKCSKVNDSETSKEVAINSKETATSNKEVATSNREVAKTNKDVTHNNETAVSNKEVATSNKVAMTCKKKSSICHKTTNKSAKTAGKVPKKSSHKAKNVQISNEVSIPQTPDKEVRTSDKDFAISKAETTTEKKVATSDKEMNILNKEVSTSTSDKQMAILNKEVATSSKEFATKEVSNQDKDDKDATSDTEDVTSSEESSTSTDTEPSSPKTVKKSKTTKKIADILTKKSRKTTDNFKNFDKLKNEKIIQEQETNKANTIMIKMPHIKSLQKVKRIRFRTVNTTPKVQPKDKKCKKHKRTYKLGRIKKVVNGRHIVHVFKSEPKATKLKNTRTYSPKTDQPTPKSNTKQKFACRINALKLVTPKHVTDKVGNSKKMLNLEMANSQTEIKHVKNPERIKNCTATDTEVNRVQSEINAQTSTKNVNLDKPSPEAINVQTTDMTLNNDTTAMPITPVKHEEPGINSDTTRGTENVSKIDSENEIKTAEKKCDESKNQVTNTNEDINRSLKRNTLTEFMGESSATIDKVLTQPVNIKKEKSTELISKINHEKKKEKETKRKESKHQAKKTNDGVNGIHKGNTITESKTDESKKFVKKSKNDNDNRKSSKDMKNENAASKSVKTEKVSKKEQEREIKKSERKYKSKHFNKKSNYHNESANGNALTETNKNSATINDNSSKKANKVTEKKSKSVKTSPSCPINNKKAKKGKKCEKNQGKTTKQNNSYKNYSENNANGTKNDANGSQNNANGSKDNDNNDKRKPFNDLTINESTSNAENFDPYELVLVKLKTAYFRISLIAYHGLILADGARYCCVCCVTVPISMIPKHIKSELHNENMDENTFLETCGNQLFRQMYTQFQCAICNILMYRKEIKMHLEWQTHIDKYDKSYNNLGKKQQKSLAGIQQFILKTKKQFNFMNNKEEKFKITNHHLTSYKVDWYSIIVDNLTNYCNKMNKIIVLCCVVVKIDFYLWNGIVGSNKLKCILCQTDIEDLDAHIRTGKHKVMADKDVLKFFYPAMIRKMDESSVNCITCNTILPLDLKLMKEHIKGKKHIISFDTHSGEEVSISSYKDCYHKVIML